MSDQHLDVQQHRKASRRRIAGAAVTFALAVAAVIVAFTGAIFTDTASVDGNVFTTGTIDISASPASAVLTASTMAPGDVTEGPLTVANDGSLELRYAVQRSATNADNKDLRDALRLRIGAQSDGSCDFPYYNTDGTPTALSGDTELYEALGFPDAATNTVGDVAQGPHAGDRVLGAAANEVLCMSVVLPLSAGNPLQDATTTVTFDFVAEQTRNNP